MSEAGLSLDTATRRTGLMIDLEEVVEQIRLRIEVMFEVRVSMRVVDGKGTLISFLFVESGSSEDILQRQQFSRRGQLLDMRLEVRLRADMKL